MDVRDDGKQDGNSSSQAAAHELEQRPKQNQLDGKDVGEVENSQRPADVEQLSSRSEHVNGTAGPVSQDPERKGQQQADDTIYRRGKPPHVCHGGLHRLSLAEMLVVVASESDIRVGRAVVALAEALLDQLHPRHHGDHAGHDPEEDSEAYNGRDARRVRDDAIPEA